MTLRGMLVASREIHQRKRKEPRRMELHVKGNRSHVAIRTDEHGNRDDLLVKLTIIAPTVTATQRLPLNLALVIDRSGSMGGQKILDAVSAAQRIVQRLGNQDYCTIVTFDDRVALIAENMQVNEPQRRLMTQALKSISVGGSTNLAGGWQLGADTLLRNPHQTECVNRVMLLTDGEANVGISDSDTLGALSGSYAARNVSTSTYGLGLNYNENLLNAMARLGQGNHYFIEQSNDIERFFSTELNQLFAAALQQCEIRIVVPAGFSCEVLGGITAVEADKTVTIKLGTLISAEQRNLYVRLVPDATTVSGDFHIETAFTGATNEGEQQHVAGAYAYRLCSVVEAAQHPEDGSISEEAAAIDLAHQQIHASAYNRVGDFWSAQQVMSVAKMRSSSMRAYGAAYDEAESEMVQHRSPATAKRAMMVNAMVSSSSGKDLDEMRQLLRELEARGEQGTHVDRLRRQIARLERQQP
jgi:Ca-activated chloride channel family protein